MSELPNTPVFEEVPKPDSAAASEPFFQTWLKAATKPNEQTYAEIAASPDASPNKAYRWVFLSALAGYFLIMGASTLTSAFRYGGDMTTSVITIVCGPFVAALVVTLLFALDAAIVQWVAKMFQGAGSYEKLVYPLAAIAAPVNLVSGVVGSLGSIPYVSYCFGVLGFGLALYTIILNAVAVKAVNKFGWGEAAGSVLLPSLAIVLVCGCLVIGSLMMMGPIVGDVFSTINQSLGDY